MAQQLKIGKSIKQMNIMKKNHKTLTLILGVVVALITLSSVESVADNNSTKKTDQIITVDMEIVKEVELKIMKTTFITESKDAKQIKIFNEDRKLIYESKDPEDRRLKIMLRRSDLFMKTKTSSYYLLN